jgi:hypothetical protein
VVEGDDCANAGRDADRQRDLCQAVSVQILFFGVFILVGFLKDTDASPMTNEGLGALDTCVGVGAEYGEYLGYVLLDRVATNLYGADTLA